jgi:hypothetical protein
MSKALKDFLTDVNLPGKVRERYKQDLENLMTDYGLNDKEKQEVKTKNIPELQKAIGAKYTAEGDPTSYVKLTTN